MWKAKACVSSRKQTTRRRALIGRCRDACAETIGFFSTSLATRPGQNFPRRGVRKRPPPQAPGVDGQALHLGREFSRDCCAREMLSSFRRTSMTVAHATRQILSHRRLPALGIGCAATASLCIIAARCDHDFLFSAVTVLDYRSFAAIPMPRS